MTGNIEIAAEILADALRKIAYEVKFLGGGENADSMGAIEFLAVQVKNGAESISSSLDNVAQAIRERE